MGAIRAVRALSCAFALLLWACPKAPPLGADTTPEGAYARVAVALAEDRPRDVFAYLEDDAQHAAFTIARERASAEARAEQAFPPPALSSYRAVRGPTPERADDGPGVFTRLAEERRWWGRLRRDLSGVDHVEADGELATVVTARGSRYAMHRRPNGIWGLTMFTAELLVEAERATRDHARVESAAADYERARGQ